MTVCNVFFSFTYTFSLGKTPGVISSKSLISVSSRAWAEMDRKSRPQATAATSDWTLGRKSLSCMTSVVSFSRSLFLTRTNPPCRKDNAAGSFPPKDAAIFMVVRLRPRCSCGIR
ncbi:hypothetical protein EYF80_046862 [Liparis tanakae]|uniref:Uncharacterized protein n=1 Tax=Liparis tanakae TaxID=230148 RepID=A0A4Z2FPG6_9TELE|nr:hypothetical protein EYF80_046862 [Liparis tanakae]